MSGVASGEDRVLVRFDTARLAVPAHWASARIALSRSSARQRLTLAALTPNRSPAARVRQPLSDRSQDANAKIE
jgi:hypothetical protein